MQAPKNVDEYIAQSPKELHGRIQELRTSIKEAVPEAEEYIGYGMAAYRYKRPIVYFGIWKEHIGIYALFPDEKKYKDKLKEYKVSKGTIQFPHDKKLPLGLIQKLIKDKISRLEEKEKKK